MGTRNLTIVKLGGKNVVAQYCQWDGYPEGQGKTILEFLRNGFNREKLSERLKVTRFVSIPEIEKLYEQVLGRADTGWVNMEEAALFRSKYPSIDRNMGGYILEFIQEGGYTYETWDFTDNKMTRISKTVTAGDEILLKDESKFADNGSCEWVWTVDLDQNIFRGRGARGPIIGEWSLDRLPTVEAMVKQFTREEDEEE